MIINIKDNGLMTIHMNEDGLDMKWSKQWTQ